MSQPGAIDGRTAHLTHDRCTRTGQPLWWVDLLDEQGVGQQQQFDHDERDQALQFCAQWVQEGLILEFRAGELERTIDVREGRPCPG